MEPERVTPNRESRFLSLPSTGIGKWSARLLLLSLVLMLLNMVLAPALQRTGLELPQAVFNLATFLCVVASGLSGLVAVVVKRERSWAVVAAVLGGILALGFELAEFVAHG